ncbi:MAG: hypothetical protein LUF87_08725, partial [Alistipes sp.]|nr:hypothetical protein [Alistipes sp.]
NGKGGTQPDNNREYGGFLKNGKVETVNPGEVANPKENSSVSIYLPTNKVTFHSHPSGDIAIRSDTDKGVETRMHFFDQHPSTIDIQGAGNQTHYVFGRRDNTVYIYNVSGVQATFPTKKFINLGK